MIKLQCVCGTNFTLLSYRQILCRVKHICEAYVCFGSNEVSRADSAVCLGSAHDDTVTDSASSDRVTDCEPGVWMCHSPALPRYSSAHL